VFHILRMPFSCIVLFSVCPFLYSCTSPTFVQMYPSYFCTDVPLLLLDKFTGPPSAGGNSITVNKYHTITLHYYYYY